jgi:hypothetical protein
MRVHCLKGLYLDNREWLENLSTLKSVGGLVATRGNVENE